MNNNQVGLFGIKTEFALAFASAMILLAWGLKISFEFGRLAFVPSYDDVSYFDDAARRYLVFANTNILEVVRDAAANPPHAPIIATQAFLAYMTFGIQDWAPYVTNVWIPFAVLLGLLAYTRNLRHGRWALFVYVLTLPMLGASIVEFRPDITVGILTAACVVLGVYAVTAREESRVTRQVMGAGLLFAAALWGKPSAALYTVAMVGLGLSLSNVALLIALRRIPKEGLKRAATIFAIGAVCALPYYVLAGRSVLNYTWNAVVRDKAIWAVDMEWIEHAGFYLLGHGGRFMLGFHVWLASAALLMLVLFHGKIDRLTRLRLFVVLGTTAAAYLVVAANVVKTHFLGVGFQALWMILTIIIFAEVVQRQAAWIARPVMVALFVGGMLSIQPAGFFGLRSGEQAQDVRRTIREVGDHLSELAGKNPEITSVFVTFTGFLNRDVLSFNLKKQGITSMHVSSWFFRPAEEDPREVFGRAIENADIVIAASEGTEVARSGMPSNKLLTFTHSLVAQHPEYRLMKTIASGKGFVYIYQRTI